MTHNGHAKIQHYVPQFLLKKFGTGKKNKFFVYDKSNQKTFQTNSKNIACEKGFYDFELEFEGQPILCSIEEILSQLESKSNKILSEIIQNNNISKITNDEKFVLSKFLAAQFMRTNNAKINYNSIPKLLKKACIKRGIPITSLSKLDQTKKEEQVSFNFMIMDSIEKIATIFFNKKWIWILNDSKMPFYLSDNPVVSHNDFAEDIEDITTINPHAIGIIGVSTYLPITPKQALWLYCPVKTEEFINNFNNNSLYKHHIQEKLYKTLTSSEPIFLEEQYIKHINSLEIIEAEKYIITPNDDFSFIAEILAKNKSIHGRRIIIE